MARRWVLNSQNGFETSLEFQNFEVPLESSLGSQDVLVKLYSASLNNRELTVAGPDLGIVGPVKTPQVPGCDGAGIVLAVGSTVTDFKPGDRVVTHTAPEVGEERGDDALGRPVDFYNCLGIGMEGTLQSHMVIKEKGLVHAPKSIDWVPAGTLTCTWATAWNALFGIKGQEATPESWILVQGSGGVSVAIIQVAAAIGANVVATVSSDEKAARLKALGAKHTVNYRTNANWGEKAKELTPQGRGFDYIADVGGNETLPQSLAAIRINGMVLILGALGQDSEPVPMSSALFSLCLVRGLLDGSRNDLQKAMNFIDEKGIKPAVDDVVYELADVKDAYRRLKEKKHFAKIGIRIDHPGE